MSSQRLFFFLILLCFSWTLSYSNQSNKSTQLIKVTIGMKENYDHLKSISPSVSNFGSDTEKVLFRRALQHHIETELLQLQMDLGKGFDELRRTQKIMIQLFLKVVESNIERTEKDLIRLTRISNRLEKTNTHHYLSMGFREIAVAKKKVLTARNSHPQIYINKIRDLSYALQSVKQAQKYVVLLALLHEGEYDSEEELENNFDVIKLEIQRVIPKNSDYYTRCHYDSNFKVYDSEDAFETIWNEPKLQELSTGIDGVDDAYFRNEDSPEVPAFSPKSN
ncbi:MAG: hypothetical protein MH321_02505 [Leptospiraceae bacterium]|nr:hypothetical protein [Leptospiraceae bacterium]